MELQKERETKNSLEVMIMSNKEQFDRLNERLRTNELKTKKFTELENENKRKHKLITDKTKEIGILKSELIQAA